MKRDSPYIIGASELLEHLQDHTQGNAICHPRRTEHVNILSHRPGFDLALSAKFGFDLLKLSVDSIVVSRGAEDLHHRLLCLLRPTHAIVVARGIWEEKDASTENSSEYPANGDDDTPGAGVAALVLIGAEVEAGREEDTESDEELVGGNQGAADPGWCGLSYGVSVVNARFVGSRRTRYLDTWAQEERGHQRRDQR